MKVSVKYHLGDKLQSYATVRMSTGFLEFDRYFDSFATYARSSLGYEVCNWDETYTIFARVETENVHKTLSLIEQTYNRVKKAYDAKPDGFSITIR